MTEKDVKLTHGEGCSSGFKQVKLIMWFKMFSFRKKPVGMFLLLFSKHVFETQAGHRNPDKSNQSQLDVFLILTDLLFVKVLGRKLLVQNKELQLP